MLKRVAPAFAGLVVVAVLAIGVPSATGHPGGVRQRGRVVLDGRRLLAVSVLAGRRGVGLHQQVGDAAATTTPTPSSTKSETRRRPRACGCSPHAPSRAPFAPYAAFNSDIAFEDGYAYQGNYEGVTIWDVRDPSNPTLAGQIALPGLAERRHGQRRDPGHVDRLAPHERHLQQRRDVDADGVHRRWEGLKVFDVSDPTEPAAPGERAAPTAARTPTRCCPRRDRLIVYVQSYDVERQQLPLREHGPAVARQDLDRRDPEGEPGGGEGHRRAGAVPGRRQRRASRAARSGRPRGCHDITVYQKIGLGGRRLHRSRARSSTSRDPVNPKVIASVEDLELRVLAQRDDQPGRQEGPVHRRAGGRQPADLQLDGRPEARRRRGLRHHGPREPI